MPLSTLSGLPSAARRRSEEHTSELQSRFDLVCRLLLEKKNSHTPEIWFEHDMENLRRALAAIRVTYPIAVDNEYVIATGFANSYWPALYLSYANGRNRY